MKDVTRKFIGRKITLRMRGKELVHEVGKNGVIQIFGANQVVFIVKEDNEFINYSGYPFWIEGVYEDEERVRSAISPIQNFKKMPSF